MATIQVLAEAFATSRAQSGLYIGQPQVVECAVDAARLYAGWAELADVSALDDPTTIAASTTLTVGEWAIIAPLFRLYVERECALVLEASRGMGVEQVGRSVSEVASEIAQLEATMPQQAYVEDVISIGIPPEA
jgi:hypothetical protein